MNDTLKILIVGCGDIGKRVVTLLLEKSYQVTAVSRSASISHLKSTGIEVINADLDQPESLGNMTDSFDCIFYFAPPQPTGITDTRMTNFLTSYLVNHPCKRLLYISTTGVYGNQDERWIDETTPVSPQADRSRRRLDAEQQIQNFCGQNGIEFIILRVAGIYSLEKLPIERLKHGKQILDRNLAGASNRIHADDLAQVCIKAMFTADSGEIFNAADGQPSTMSDYFVKVAEIFDLPPPEEVDWQYAETHFSPEMLSYLRESKKISADKILNQLGVLLKYPSLNEGLKQCKEQNDAENNID